MIRHLLKLVWHRKRANALVVVEIFCSFLVVFVVATMAVSLASRWGAPLAFDWHDVWVVNFNLPLPGEHSSSHMSAGPSNDELQQSKKTAANADAILRELRSYPEVESVGADAMTPYANATWLALMTPNGRRLAVTRDQATDDFARVMRLRPIRGRWFIPSDDADDFTPLVIDTDAAKAMFGTADPIGQTFESPGGVPGVHSSNHYRVVGLIAPYRNEGELSTPNQKMVFSRASMTHPNGPDANHIVLRVRPGTPASFELELANRLHRLSPDGTFRVRKMWEMRKDVLKLQLAPIIVLSVVAFFLISMVGLGLTGVLWQTVTRRTHELGLRRALGATAGSVRGQVLVEVALLATLAVAAGTLIVAQLPMLGLWRLVSGGELAAGLGAALVVIYAITLVCGAYPSWLASTVQPAEALRYE